MKMKALHSVIWILMQFSVWSLITFCVLSPEFVTIWEVDVEIWQMEIKMLPLLVIIKVNWKVNLYCEHIWAYKYHSPKSNAFTSNYPFVDSVGTNNIHMKEERKYASWIHDTGKGKEGSAHLLMFHSFTQIYCSDTFLFLWWQDMREEVDWCAEFIFPLLLFPSCERIDPFM